MKVTLKRRASSEAKSFHENKVLNRVLLGRGLDNKADIETNLAGLINFSSLKDISLACDILLTALRNQCNLLIIGDFDADGATSCAVGLKALKLLGFNHVNYLVPNRFEYGYGLTPEIVELAKSFSPDLIITVDNGISSVAGVKAAKALGWKVLITDHHLPGDETPAADAIINPNQRGCAFSSKALAGVGVIFYLMLAFRSRLRDINWFTQSNTQEPNLAELLDLVALGTVADIVPLDKNNRILVQQGLQRIRAGRACAGIQALLDIAGKSSQYIGATDIGFAIGPRLNAAGRLDDMALGIECLLSVDKSHALKIANELNELNDERKAIQTSMTSEAMEAVGKIISSDTELLPSGLCLYDDTWHQGVVGLVASKVKDKVLRPTIAFANDADGWLKGSARSIPGIHIRDALDMVAKRHPSILSKFGGHAMAAGLSIKEQDYETFQQVFAQVVLELGQSLIGQKEIWSDGPLALNELNIHTAECLSKEIPFGQCFEPPLFDGVFEIKAVRILKEVHCKWRIKPCDDTGSPHDAGQSAQIMTETFDGILFNADETCLKKQVGDKVHICYQIDINRFRNKETLQLMIAHVLD
jgi:single-stranded-DNA-specific exonuclease